MVKGKIFKTLSTIFECIGVGGILVYFYNYFTLKGKYDLIPKELNANLNTYLLIGVSGILLFIIFRILIYFITPKNKYEQVEMDLNETLTNTNMQYSYNEETKYIQEDKYIVPTEKQTTCSNCGKIVDKNATICLHCGFLLQSLQTMKDRFDEQKFVIQSFKKLEEKFEEFLDKLDKRNDRPVEQSYNRQPVSENISEPIYEPKIQYQEDNNQNIEDPRYKYEETVVKKENNNTFLFTYFLTKAIPVIIIVALLSLGGYMLVTKLNSNPVSDVGTKTAFYDIANNIINEVETKYKNNELKLNKNTVYFSLNDLHYLSEEYNTDKSYIAINASDKNNIQYYISLVGIKKYNNYSINITEKKDLDVTDVVLNAPAISDIDGKLLVDNEFGVTIYYKE